MRDYFLMLAGYNQWANGRLFDAAAALPPERFTEQRGAFFGSLCGTLNHILIGDRAWLRRITGEGPQPSRLDEVCHADLPSLWVVRMAEDERLIRVMEGLDDARLSAPLAYRTMAGLACEQPLYEVLAHVFNHHTHHRGQAHGLLSQMGVEPPALDLVYYLRRAIG